MSFRRIFAARLGALSLLMLGASCGSSGDVAAPDGAPLLDLPAPMTRAALEDFATRYAAAWSGQDAAELASFYAEGGTLVVNDGEPSIGRAAIAAKAAGFMEAFPDMRVALDELEVVDGHVRFHWIWTGTNTGPGGTGNAVHLEGFEDWTLSADGLISESRGRYDAAEYERQVGGES